MHKQISTIIRFSGYDDFSITNKYNLTTASGAVKVALFTKVIVVKINFFIYFVFLNLK